MSEQRSANVNNTILGIGRIPAKDTIFGNKNKEEKNKPQV